MKAFPLRETNVRKTIPLWRAEHIKCLVPRAQGTSVNLLGAEVLLRHTYITPEAYSQHPKIWDHQGVEIMGEVQWGLQNSAQSRILSLLHLENENQSKISSGIYFISPTLKTSLFRKEKPKALTHWLNKHSSHIAILCASQHKDNQFSSREACPGFSLLRAPQLPKASEQPSPSPSSTNNKAYMWASTTH